jgi:hypothetical protein
VLLGVLRSPGLFGQWAWKYDDVTAPGEVQYERVHLHDAEEQDEDATL